MNAALFVALAVVLFSNFVFARSKARAFITHQQIKPRSRPVYHGLYVTVWCALPALLILAVWLIGESYFIQRLISDEIIHSAARPLESQELSIEYTEVINVANGVLKPKDEAIRTIADEYNSLHSTSRYALGVVFLAALLLGGLFGYSRLKPALAARENVERVIKGFLFLSSTIAILTTIGIVLALIFESIRFFNLVPIHEFLFGLKWSPQIALRTDQVGSSGSFGAVPLFAGTFQIAALAMLVAVPIGLLSAIYLSEYAAPRVRSVVKPLLEILAGVPTVVYGFFAALTVAPMIRDFALSLGIEASSESALAAGVVMGIMIIPFVSSLSDDVISAVPQSLREGSLALGATKSETIRQVIFPAALPGIAGAILLAVSRAIGETMIVVMAAGLAANLTMNPFENVTTITVQIVTILVGDQEFDSAKTLAAFALGLLLFIVTLILNIIALHIVRRYREKYD